MAYEPLDVTDFDKTNPFDVEKIRHLEGGIQENEKAIADVNADLTDINIFGQGSVISSGADLNDYTTVGKYYTASSSVSGSLSNTPFTNGGLSLYVLRQSADSGGRLMQLVFGNVGSSNPAPFIRYYSGSAWQPWWQVQASQIDTNSISTFGNEVEDA